jgi:O-antigen ligase
MRPTYFNLENLSYYSLIICVALLPVQMHLIPPFMIAMVIFWYLEKKNEISLNFIKDNESGRLMAIFLLLFVWQLIGLAFADSMGSGIERIYKRASFVLFPLALYFPVQKIKLNIRLILNIYTVCVFAYVVFCLGNALANSLILQDGKLLFRPYDDYYTYESFFAGARLSAGIHPSYLAMYVLLAMIFSISNSFEPDIRSGIRIFWIVISIVFLIVIALLSSRSGIIAAVVIIPVFLVYKLRNRIPLWLVVAALILFTALFAVLLAKNMRIKTTMEDVSNETINEALNKDVRLNIWRSAWGVIKVNPVIGVGTGNASKELKKEFIRRGYTEGFYEDLNAHSQFLEILLENGVIGLMIFLGILGYMEYIAIADKNFILQVFIIMCVIFFIFESMLNRLAGVMFFPLFTFLILHLKMEE